MIRNSALLLILISTVAALPPASDPSKNVTRSSGIVGTTPRGQELVTKGCKTMIPEGPKKFWESGLTLAANSTKKPGENGVSASMCIKCAPEENRSRSGNSLGAPWKHVTNGLKYKVYIAHPIRGNVGDVEASREDCENRLNQVLTECVFLGAGGYILVKKNHKEHLYDGLSVSECDGDLLIV
ncbi:hypothetical protein HOY80DRAFT_999531 [Tuber brumale]|nr:hypothetical protein HOY80DRAFT_999531 [Tuber brumale]